LLGSDGYTQCEKRKDGAARRSQIDGRDPLGFDLASLERPRRLDQRSRASNGDIFTLHIAPKRLKLIKFFLKH
jgi:hypothetical protein